MKLKRRRQIIEVSTGEMVTVDELLKDNPKMLEELKVFRKRMDENPHLFSFPEEKKTQGQKKMKQLLEDARRNSRFTKKLGEVAKSKPLHDVRKLNALYALHRWFLVELETFRKKYLLRDRTYELKRSLCRKYGIDPILFDRLISAFRNGRIEGWDFNEDTSSDMCTIEVQEGIDGLEDIHTFHLMTVDRIEQEVYPVKIKIHRFASKRDILDFIEKDWSKIKPYLQNKRIRGRKMSREIVDLIWKHRNRKAKEIKTFLDEKYPKNGLVYYEINKILNDEKKRRKVQNK
jgi:hypothetical protein